MIKQKTSFCYALMTLMNLCLEAINYSQCTTAFYGGYDPKVRANKARACVFEALMTKLVLIITLIGYEDKHSYHIRDLIKYAKENKNIFTIDGELVVKQSNEFLEELKLNDDKFQMILKFRHGLFAHLNKNEIEKNTNSPIHPFHELVNDIMKEFNICNSDEFFSKIDQTIELYSRILNFYNSISDESFKFRFSANVHDKSVYEDAQKLFCCN